MYPYEFDELTHDIQTLALACSHFKPDAIIAVARGGLIAAQLLAYALDIRNIQTVRIESYDNTEQRTTLTLYDMPNLSECERVLIVDDIIDSGQTLQHLLEKLQTQYPNLSFKSASLYYKPTASIQPDFTCKEATTWIDFFWERKLF